MLPRQELYREITKAFKPWVKKDGILWLFHDAYARVGLVWSSVRTEEDLEDTAKGRLKAVRAARRSARYV
jgi:hypothetical protein